MASNEKQVHETLDRLIQRRRFPGIQYLVVDARDTRFEYCGGLRDLNRGAAVDSATTFLASSSTKTLTAAAVLQGIDRGRIKLDQSLSTYYSDHPYGNEVTIRHLLNQTSGVPNPLPLHWVHDISTHAAFDSDAALKEVLSANPKLRFPPGDRYAYSNISYWLLGKVIESTSGQSFPEYLRRNLLDPLGAGRELDCIIPNPDAHAVGYQEKYSMMGLVLYLMMDREMVDRTEAGRFRLKPVYMNGTPYGGIIGTARGFARFLQDQLREESILFGPETKALYFSHQKNNRGEEIVTTLGWHRGVVSDVPYYGKPGGGPGFHSNIRIYPEKGIATAWFINQTAVSESPINKFGDSLDRYFLT